MYSSLLSDYTAFNYYLDKTSSFVGDSADQVHNLGDIKLIVTLFRAF